MSEVQPPEPGSLPTAEAGSDASSDVRVAIGLLKAGLHGARHNVDINLGSLKDEEYVGRVSEEVRRLSESA